MSRIGVYVRLNGSLERISSFKHMTDHSLTDAHNNPAPDGKVFVLKCKDCGGSSFTDEGRFVNELACECCVESYTEVFYHRD